jgi:hypothetical protein
MVVGFDIGGIVDEVGDSEVLHSFFSTISYHLEPDGWGSKYPELMLQLYEGRLESSYASKVLKDVLEIREKLRTIPADQVVWDIDDLEIGRPLGWDVSFEDKTLSAYFVTSMGKDFFDVLIECLEDLQKEGGYMTIEPIEDLLDEEVEGAEFFPKTEL